MAASEQRLRRAIVAQTYALEAQARKVTGKKVGALRRSGLVPCVIYGVKTPPVSVQIPARALQLTLMKAGGTHLIDMSVDGQAYSVLARDVQRNVVRGDIIHVDFLAVDASTKITAQVPVRFINESPAVRSGAGVLLQGVNTLTIEALPKDLIDGVEVDLSLLAEIGSTIHVRDIAMPGTVTLVDDADEMVARIVMTAAAVSEEAAEADAITAAEPEVIGKGKKEDEFED
jgi:large subunit ribosomal protein L25